MIESCLKLDQFSFMIFFFDSYNLKRVNHRTMLQSNVIYTTITMLPETISLENGVNHFHTRKVTKLIVFDNAM